MKIFVSPPNSLILSDLIERFGHEPLTVMKRLEKRIKTPEIDSPPLNITSAEPIKGLKYASNEVPSGVRGRMAIIGPMIEEAEAAIIVENADYSFGCIGCDRTNELIKYLIKREGIPILRVNYPTNSEEGENMVKKIKVFLRDLK